MKKYLKLFFIGLLLFVMVDKNTTVFADYIEDPEEFERLSTKKLNSYCPESGDPSLVSICGRVVQALPSTMPLNGGSTSPSTTQVPVEGVSVYLYECDNSSRSCKRDGLLVHPFSSTSTNKDGLFHLVGRKLDNVWSHSYPNPYTNHVDLVDEEVEIANQSKKRYLVFKCGGYFRGIHIIPSYVDITEVVHEVNCPDEYLPMDSEKFLYVPPLLQFDFVGGVKLAAHMGIEEKEGEDYYPPQRGEHTESHTDEQGNVIYDGLATTIQAHYDEYAYNKNQSVQVILKGADPRFTSPSSDPGKLEAIVSAANNRWWETLWETLTGDTNLEDKVPELGAWWSEDCKIQYAGTDWFEYCDKIKIEENLYNDPEISKEFLLPSLPPKQSILYYRPLEIRNEISAYYQDQDDLAKYMGSMFANCMGPAFKRIWETDSDETDLDYPDCELLKQCNSTLNSDNNINTLTTGGIFQGLMSPNSLEELEYEKIPDIPVCLIDGEEDPVLLKQIQRPGQLACVEYDPVTKSGMRLCENGAYWNNYFLTNLGHNNTTTQFGLAGENKEDSYSRKKDADGELSETGADVNDEVFKKGGEGDGSLLGGQGVISNNLVAPGSALKFITSGSNILVDALAQPFANEKVKKEISEGIPYYISSRPVAWGQYSKTNDYPEKIITSSSADDDYLDPHAFSREMECESCAKEHYPEDYLLKQEEIEIKKGKEWGGSRTPFQGITVTTAADLRNRSLSELDDEEEWKDKLDSQISVSTGFSYIDWSLAKIKKPESLSDFLIKFFNEIFGELFDDDDKTEYKTFVDRKPENMVDNANEEFEFNDELVAYGYKVNESNFLDLFPCPSSSSLGSWGPFTEEGIEAVNECYPWHPLPKGEPCESSTSACNDIITGTSNTCKLDKCESGTVTFIYNCGPNEGGPIEITITGKEVKRAPGVCPDTINSCVFEQTGTGDGPETIEPLFICKPSDENKIGLRSKPFYYDYCRVARAGPNQCDGNILIDSEVAVHSQTIYDQDDENSPESFVADKIPESGQNLQKSFREPFKEDFSYMPAAWVSVTSSLSETEPDTSLRKDFPGIGIGTSFLTRAWFGQPRFISSSNKLEPLYIHCSNTDLGTVGTWDDGKECPFAEMPDPETIDLKFLEAELANSIEDGGTNCLLKEDVATCENLFLGDSESGESLKFSETFKLVLNLAGIKFDVEPAAILLYMHKIGADKEYSYYWSEEGEDDLKKFALSWYGGFPQCDDLEPVKQPPFDWKLTYFYEIFNTTAKPLNTTDSPKSVLKELFGREQTASRCNFIDSIFTLAGSFAKSLVKIQVDSEGNPILYTDITCNEQAWDDYMKNALKVQYYQLQINWDDELKGTLSDDQDLFSSPEYENLWNACRQ